MQGSLATLAAALPAVLGDALVATTTALGEVTVVVRAGSLLPAMTALRDDDATRFDQLIDVCGVDYSAYNGPQRDGPRYASVYHLLSTVHNWRLRVRTFAPDDDFPVVDSVIGIWPAANWFERESFDLYGILYTGHPDLRRLLTDYGFVGHPFRKDFPISGTVEMRFDPEQGRVIYQPVTIEPREITPRIVRENAYAADPGFEKG
ncbi:MAG: NADH-quinone oxidoreductase subunit C [Proteobacteria bacterium]|nr:NADH-quinone oxidoreductase subunit C [Pseudomonadota bacterium]